MFIDVVMMALESIPHGHFSLVAERRIAEVVCQSDRCKERGDISGYLQIGGGCRQTPRLRGQRLSERRYCVPSY